MVGHSSLAGEAFREVLRAHRIDVLCDVRAWPGSRRWPHFDREELSAALASAEIEYRWLGKELGGYGKDARPDSRHTALEGGRRNYADHLIALEDAAVLHILGLDAPRRHRLDPRARIADQKLVCDVGLQQELF